MKGAKFEKRTAAALTEMGIFEKIRICGRTNDQGIDVTATLKSLDGDHFRPPLDVVVQVRTTALFSALLPTFLMLLTLGID